MFVCNSARLKKYVPPYRVNCLVNCETVLVSILGKRNSCTPWIQNVYMKAAYAIFINFLLLMRTVYKQNELMWNNVVTRHSMNGSALQSPEVSAINITNNCIHGPQTTLSWILESELKLTLDHLLQLSCLHYMTCLLYTSIKIFTTHTIATSTYYY